MDQHRKFIPSFMLSVLAGNSSRSENQADKPLEEGVLILAGTSPGMGQPALKDRQGLENEDKPD